MASLDQSMNRFRLASRELFNSYFRLEEATASTEVEFQQQAWSLYKKYAEVESLLFEKLVLEPAQLSGTYGERNARIRVALTSPFAPIMLNRGTDTGYWDHPLREVTQDASMDFLCFFDWDDLAYRDHRYVRVYVADWPAHPEAAERDALIETQYVRYIPG